MSTSEVVVYWRPGCPYCMRLRGGLRRAGLPTREVNIWEDPAGAETVRALADGNETVPTVTILTGGESSWATVNPSARQVLEAVRAQAPELLAGVPPKSWWSGLRALLSN